MAVGVVLVVGCSQYRIVAVGVVIVVDCSQYRTVAVDVVMVIGCSQYRTVPVGGRNGNRFLGVPNCASRCGNDNRFLAVPNCGSRCSSGNRFLAVPYCASRCSNGNRLLVNMMLRKRRISSSVDGFSPPFYIQRECNFEERDTVIRA